MALMLALNLQAQTAPDADELTRLLKEFLAGPSQNDAATHDRFWAEDLIYTGSSGRRIGKADIMRDMRSAPATLLKSLSKNPAGLHLGIGDCRISSSAGKRIKQTDPHLP